VSCYCWLVISYGKLVDLLVSYYLVCACSMAVLCWCDSHHFWMNTSGLKCIPRLYATTMHRLHSTQFNVLVVSQSTHTHTHSLLTCGGMTAPQTAKVWSCDRTWWLCYWDYYYYYYYYYQCDTITLNTLQGHYKTKILVLGLKNIWHIPSLASVTPRPRISHWKRSVTQSD